MIVKSLSELFDHLEGKPKGLLRVVVTRAVLRLLPNWIYGWPSSVQAINAFRVAFILWVRVRYPEIKFNENSQLFAGTLTHTVENSSEILRVRRSKSASAALTVGAFEAAYRSHGSINVLKHVWAVVSAKYRSIDGYNKGEEEFCENIMNEFSLIEREYYNNGQVVLDRIPDFNEFYSISWGGTSKDFDYLRNDLFTPWMMWYESLTSKNGSKSPKEIFDVGLSLRILSQSDEWWSRSPRAVNADIARWLAEQKPDDLGDYIGKISELEGQLTQRPAASFFGWADGKLTAEPPPAVQPDSLAQDFLQEARGKAADLRERLSRTNAAPRVHKSLDALIAVLPEATADLRPGLLRSRARSLHADATAYAGQFQDGELPVDAIAMLLDLSGNLRDLEGCFPQLKAIEREIDALNLKPADVASVQKYLSEINDVVSTSDVVADSAKSVMSVGTETMKAEAAPEIVEVRTAEQALTVRNLTNAALKGCLQQILSRLPDTTGRVYDETEKAGLNLIRPAASVGASVLVASLVNPIAGLALFALAEYDRLPGIINFIKEAKKQVGPSEGDLE